MIKAFNFCLIYCELHNYLKKHYFAIGKLVVNTIGQNEKLLKGSFAGDNIKLFSFHVELVEVEERSQPGLHSSRVGVNFCLEIRLVHSGVTKCHLKVSMSYNNLLRLRKNTLLGGSPGLVVMGDDS